MRLLSFLALQGLVITLVSTTAIYLQHGDNHVAGLLYARDIDLEECIPQPRSLSSNTDVFNNRLRRLRRAPAKGPFVCAVCGESFDKEYNLRGHERSHSGSKPYECLECGKAFARAGDLNKHSQLHSS